MLRKLLEVSAAFAAACAIAGCWSDSGKIHYLGHADLNYYKSKATKIDYTPASQKVNEYAISTDVPRTVAEIRKDQIWDVTLAEVIQIALANNRIIRTAAAETLDPAGNGIYANANGAPSVYDPAIQESGVLFGGRGVEAALADFDAQLSTSMVGGRDEMIANVRNSGLGPGPTIISETGAFRSRLQKITAYGGVIGVDHNWDYLWQNSPGRLFPSAYTGVLSADYRQPLWAGSGTEYTRIAGPLNPNFGGITGVSQGVVIARINQDLSLADFEANVRNMLRDVEFAYWDLYLAYQTYDIQVRIRNLALQVWREEKTRTDAGTGDFSALAQALDAYFERKSQVDTALSQIYSRELLLRRLCVLQVNDCRIMRPADEPTSAEFVPDWCASLAEGLTHRVELRRQKWNIKSLELQLIAAKSLTNPQFDFVSQYRVNAFGDRLFGENDQDGVTDKGLRSGYERLTEGDETGWNLGFEFSMPIGFRSAHTQVRNIELRLAKARDVLSNQELEVSYELGRIFQDMTVNYETAQDNFNRRAAAIERVRILDETIEVGKGLQADLINRRLQAQTSLGLAEVGYFTSLVNYNKSLTDYYFRKGLLLEHNNVHLAEDRWKPEAYREAIRRAWARSHALPNPLLDTEPHEFARAYKRGDPHASDRVLDGHDGTKPGAELAPPPEPTEPNDNGREAAPEVPETKPIPPSAPKADGTTRTDRAWEDRSILRASATRREAGGTNFDGWEDEAPSPRPASRRLGEPTGQGAASGRREGGSSTASTRGRTMSAERFPEESPARSRSAGQPDFIENPGLRRSSGQTGKWTLKGAIQSQFEDDEPSFPDEGR
jgi:outer membrane protein TolC